jgi:hypothetical protein
VSELARARWRRWLVCCSAWCFQAELGTFTNSLKNLSTVSAAQAGSAAVIGVESYFLFNVGEIVGRGSLVGYDIGPNGYREKH